MKIISCVGLILFLCFLIEHLSYAQTSMSSTDWEFKQIANSVQEKENRVRAVTNEVLAKVIAALAEVSSNAALSLTIKALESTRDFLMKLSTVASYGNETTILACDNLPLRISNIRFDIEKCVRIKIQIDVNATLLFIEAAKVKNAYVYNFVPLTDAQKKTVWSVFTSLLVLFDELNSYSVAEAMAIYKYARLNIQLLFLKTTFCNCPTLLNADSSSKLAIVDSNIKEIQATVDSREANIRKISTDVLAKVAAINPNLKKNVMYIYITTTLDSIVTFVKGYQVLKTTDIINSTTNCDDAAMKVAFLEYKLEMYLQASVEAAKNTTYTLNYLATLIGYTNTATYMLTEAEKTGLKDVTTFLTSLVDEYRQYILALAVAEVKLVVQLFDARTARTGSCSCTGTSNSTLATTQSKLSFISFLCISYQNS